MRIHFHPSVLSPALTSSLFISAIILTRPSSNVNGRLNPLRSSRSVETVVSAQNF